MALDDLGNQAIDFVWGNMPLQPNNTRFDEERPLLSANDSHAIALSEWNSYPSVATGANYMITALEYLGDDVYECTSQNNLKAGDVVFVKDIPGFPTPTNETVTYADATKFRFEEAGAPAPFKATGLYGRADLFVEGTGRSAGDGMAFYWPAIGPSYTGSVKESYLPNIIKELIASGVPEEFLVPATFEGGDSWHDTDGDFVGGSIFYYYVSPTDTFGTDPQGKTIYGTDMDDFVLYSAHSPNDVVTNDGSWNDYTLTVFQSHTPSLNTASWL